MRQATNKLEHISPSRLNLWLKCPLAYKLRYIDKLVTPTPPNLFLGKMVHAGLERYYRYRARDITLYPETVTTYINANWERAAEEEVVSFKSLDDKRACKEKACDLLTAYIGQVPKDEPSPLAAEQRLEAPLVDPQTGQVLGKLLGIIDLVLDGHDGPILVDFKTAARLSATLDITHELQLSCYSYLLRHTYKTKEQSLEIRSLIKTKIPKVETHSYRSRQEFHFERLFAVVRTYLKSVNEGAFHIRPGIGCSFCDFRESACGDLPSCSLAA